MADKYQFGNFIYQLRKEMHLSQKELGALAGVSNKAVSKWETGEAFPKTQTLRRLSEIFHCSFDELMLISRSDEAAYLDRIRQITEERDELRKKVEDIQAAQKRKRIAAYVTVSLCVVCALSVLLAALLTPYLHIRHNSVLFEGELSKIFYNGWYHEPYTGAVLPDNARKHSFEKGRGASYETVYLHALEDQPFFISVPCRNQERIFCREDVDAQSLAPTAENIEYCTIGSVTANTGYGETRWQEEDELRLLLEAVSDPKNEVTEPLSDVIKVPLTLHYKAYLLQGTIGYFTRTESGVPCFYTERAQKAYCIPSPEETRILWLILKFFTILPQES